MVDEHVSVVIGEDSRVARSVDVAVAGQKLSPAAFHHGRASLVSVGAGDTARTSDHGAVGAIDSLAAFVESGPEVVIVATLGDVWSFDGAAVGRARGDGDEIVAVDGLTGRRAQLDKLEARPEGTEREPPLSVSVDEEVRVDGVVVATVGRLDHETHVGPRAGGASLACGEEDRRMSPAKGRGRVVHVVLAVMVGEVRCPQIFVAIGVSGRPRGAIGECGADVVPGGAVRGCLETNAVGCEGSEISAIGFLNYSGIVDEGVAIDRTRVDGSLLQGRGERSDGEDASSEDAVEGDHAARLRRMTGLVVFRISRLYPRYRRDRLDIPGGGRRILYNEPKSERSSLDASRVFRVDDYCFG